MQPQIDSQSLSKSSSDHKTRTYRRSGRVIRDVLGLIDQVQKCREGYADPQSGKTVKLSIKEATKRLGVSRKSLDYYKKLVAEVREANFDFESNMDSKVGVLRTFLRKHSLKSEKSSVQRKLQREDVDFEINSKSKKI